MEWENGIYYEGAWSEGLYHGKGVKAHKNGGGYAGDWKFGLRQGLGENRYAGKWGYDRWQGPFEGDNAHGEGVMFLSEGNRMISFEFDRGEQAGTPPCNEEYEKAVFFRRLSA